MTEEKEWVRLGGKDGVYLVEGEDYTVDREKGILTINEEAWAKVHERKRIAGGEQYAYPPPSGILPHVLSFGGEFTDIEDVELKNITRRWLVVSQLDIYTDQSQGEKKNAD
jgi:hypothetical protein